MENRGRRGGVGGSVYRTHWKRRMGKEGKCHVPSHPITVSHSWKERERERVFFVHCPMVTVRPFSNAQRTLPPSPVPPLPWSHIPISMIIIIIIFLPLLLLLIYYYYGRLQTSISPNSHSPQQHHLHPFILSLFFNPLLF